MIATLAFALALQGPSEPHWDWVYGVESGLTRFAPDDRSLVTVTDSAAIRRGIDQPYVYRYPRPAGLADPVETIPLPDGRIAYAAPAGAGFEVGVWDLVSDQIVWRHPAASSDIRPADRFRTIVAGDSVFNAATGDEASAVPGMVVSNGSSYALVGTGNTVSYYRLPSMTPVGSEPGPAGTLIGLSADASLFLWQSDAAGTILNCAFTDRKGHEVKTYKIFDDGSDYDAYGTLDPSGRAFSYGYTEDEPDDDGFYVPYYYDYKVTVPGWQDAPFGVLTGKTGRQLAATAQGITVLESNGTSVLDLPRLINPARPVYAPDGSRLAIPTGTVGFSFDSLTGTPAQTYVERQFGFLDDGRMWGYDTRGNLTVQDGDTITPRHKMTNVAIGGTTLAGTVPGGVAIAEGDWRFTTVLPLLGVDLSAPVSVSVDGRRVLAGTLLIDVATRTAVRLANPKVPYLAAINGTGGRIALAQHNRIVILDANGQIVHSLTRDGEPLSDLAFSGEGKWVASLGTNGHLRVWRAGDGSLQRDWTVPDTTSGYLAFTRDGSRIAVVSNTGYLRQFTLR